MQTPNKIVASAHCYRHRQLVDQAKGMHHLLAVTGERTQQCVVELGHKVLSSLACESAAPCQDCWTQSSEPFVLCQRWKATWPSEWNSAAWLAHAWCVGPCGWWLMPSHAPAHLQAIQIMLSQKPTSEVQSFFFTQSLIRSACYHLPGTACHGLLTIFNRFEWHHKMCMLRQGAMQLAPHEDMMAVYMRRATEEMTHSTAFYLHQEAIWVHTSWWQLFWSVRQHLQCIIDSKE